MPGVVRMRALAPCSLLSARALPAHSSSQAACALANAIPFPPDEYSETNIPSSVGERACASATRSRREGLIIARVCLRSALRSASAVFTAPGLTWKRQAARHPEGP